jgi:hypothetical protein
MLRTLHIRLGQNERESTVTPQIGLPMPTIKLSRGGGETMALNLQLYACRCSETDPFEH